MEFIVPIAALLAATVIDPGPRVGDQAGGPILVEDSKKFEEAKAFFIEESTVSGGLGPKYNAVSCASCHIFPAVGGSSPAINPQIKEATLNGADNKIPSFLSINGPIREVRFVYDTDGTLKGKKKLDLGGGVETLFTISGMDEAKDCKIYQYDFDKEMKRNKAVFRIPTPLLGLGLVESIPDEILKVNAVTNKELGISPHFNHSGHDGTISKFGWKAQVESLLIFSGEAYNVEQGVTNLLFPTEREAHYSCKYVNTHIEDKKDDVFHFTTFMQLAAPPRPFPLDESSRRGKMMFETIGCAACHVQTQTTFSGVKFEPYSDFSLHAMGDVLADNIIQGEAAGDEFRTAPLWGVSQRLFFLHDGRTNDLLQAILLHEGKKSQANAVIKKFKELIDIEKQNILNFLRSL